MNYDELIKVWEKILKTGDAPIGEHWGISITTQIAKETYDMLNHQKAEIDRFKENAKRSNEAFQYSEILPDYKCMVMAYSKEGYDKFIKDTQTKAIKEFEEKLREMVGD